MGPSFGTPVPSYFRADDFATQRANAGQSLPGARTHLHKHSDGCTDCTVGTKDEPHLCCHPEAVRVSPAPSGRCSPSPSSSIAWPPPVRTSQQAGVLAFTARCVWETSNTSATAGRSQERTASQGWVEVLWVESWRWHLGQKSFSVLGWDISGYPCMWGPG